MPKSRETDIMRPMAQRLEELPLFPLSTVLFPYAPIHLHIFEERYREMIRLCLEEDKPFGVVLLKAGEEVGDEQDPYMVGTAARIHTAHTYDDGRLDIAAKGEGRFRIRQFDNSRPYLVGMVEPLIEEPMEESPSNDRLVRKAKEAAEGFISACFAGMDIKVAEVKLHEDPVVLSFMIAGLLHGPNLERQRLLEMTSTRDRLAEMIPMLEKLMEEASLRVTQRLTASEALERLCMN